MFESIVFDDLIEKADYMEIFSIQAKILTRYTELKKVKILRKISNRVEIVLKPV